MQNNVDVKPSRALYINQASYVLMLVQKINYSAYASNLRTKNHIVTKHKKKKGRNKVGHGPTNTLLLKQIVLENRTLFTQKGGMKRIRKIEKENV